MQSENCNSKNPPNAFNIASSATDGDTGGKEKKEIRQETGEKEGREKRRARAKTQKKRWQVGKKLKASMKEAAKEEINRL